MEEELNKLMQVSPEQRVALGKGGSPSYVRPNVASVAPKFEEPQREIP
jgi:hypothetical protein